MSIRYRDAQWWCICTPRPSCRGVHILASLHRFYFVYNQFVSSHGPESVGRSAQLTWKGTQASKQAVLMMLNSSFVLFCYCLLMKLMNDGNSYLTKSDNTLLLMRMLLCLLFLIFKLQELILENDTQYYLH